MKHIVWWPYKKDRLIVQDTCMYSDVTLLRIHNTSSMNVWVARARFDFTFYNVFYYIVVVVIVFA